MIDKTYFGESSTIEFKRQISKRHETFLKDIIAFANTSGGKVYIGVDDSGEVVGIGDVNPFRMSDDITNMIYDACSPMIDVEIEPVTLEGKTVLEVEVFSGKQRPYYLKSRGKESSTYIRTNGTSRPADDRKLMELEYEGRRISYDTLPEIGEKFDASAAETLCKAMYDRAVSTCKTQEEANSILPVSVEKLIDLGILEQKGKELMPTHAFSFLTEPKEPFIKMQCALFKGTDRGVFIDRKEYTGPVQDQADEAYKFVLSHINMGAEIDGIGRRDVYELPTQTIREVIVNAVLHRSYLDPAAVQVSIYDDRVEVDSPGMLYGGLSVRDALGGKSKCRNTALAAAFRYMKIIEAWGTGLPRMLTQCSEMGLPEPRFIEFGDGVKVVIYRKTAQLTDVGVESGNSGEQAKSMKVSDKKQATKTSDKKQATKTSDKKQPTNASGKNNLQTQAIKTTDKVTRHEDLICKMLGSKSSLNTQDIAAGLELSADRTRAILRSMAARGILIAEGANRNRTYRLANSDDKTADKTTDKHKWQKQPINVSDKTADKRKR